MPSSVGSEHLLHWHVNDQWDRIMSALCGEPTLMPTYLEYQMFVLIMTLGLEAQTTENIGGKA